MQRTTPRFWTSALAAAAVGLLTVGPALAGNGEGDRGDRPEREQRSSERGQRSAGAERGPGGPGGDRPTRGREMVRLLFRDVQLTDSQKEDVREVMQQARAERQAWLAENGEQLAELRERMQDAAAIRDTDAMQEIGQELRVIMSAGPQPMAVAEEVRGMLTSEQAEQFDTNVAELQQRMEQRRAQGRAGRGGEDRRNAGPDGSEGKAGRGGAEGKNGRGGAEGRNGFGGAEGKNGQGKARGEREGVDREAIEQRLREFRAKRDAQRDAEPPAMDDNDFSDEPADSDKDDGKQLDL